MISKKITLVLIIFISILFTINGVKVNAAEINYNQKNIIYYTTELKPRADIIDWRYKTENNKLYRRLYNYSKDMWIGEWELL